ncbi:GtrA family protein [Secundilactobacillus paracollinoides]|uniref:GtrA family protein n=1 Tax=Secundilactobacillus paracollinoides TaxID=240427 RepID=UPI0006D290DC|nr:GtrA family protein [Secundilactobacillus paracollinoides]KRL78994.1 GtcA family membrane protein [Secundilactobacillus paracollinoides DSM 15502 = JCM 11969]
MQTLITLFHKYESVISYLFFGGLTTLINIGVFVWLSPHIYYQVANVIAWFLSVLFAFITNKLWVFHSKTMVLRTFIWEMASFFFFRIASLGVDALILWVGISLLNGNTIVVKLIDQIVVVILNYFFSKWFIFRKTN